MKNLDRVLKSKDITLPTKVCIIKAMVFPVVIYRCESWTIEKAECWRIDAFVLWCWRRLLRVPWKAKKSNQSILKEINPEYSLEGLMLKLKLKYSGHLMRRAGSLEKTLMLGKIEGRRRRGWQRVRWLDGITASLDMNLGKLWERVSDRKAWRAAVHGVTKNQTQLGEWITTTDRQFRCLWKKSVLLISFESVWVNFFPLNDLERATMQNWVEVVTKWLNCLSPDLKGKIITYHCSVEC